MPSETLFDDSGTLKKFIIDRSEWLPGRLRPTGCGVLWDPKMGGGCCLGLLCRASGLAEEKMSSFGLPHHLGNDVLRELPKWLRQNLFEGSFWKPSHFSLEAARRNDLTGAAVPFSELETQLKDCFLKVGVDLEFVGVLRA